MIIGDGRCHASRRNRSRREAEQEPGETEQEREPRELVAEHAHLVDGRGGKLCARVRRRMGVVNKA